MRFLFFTLVSASLLFGATMEELVDFALSNSTAIKQAKLNVELSKSKRDRNRADQFGEVDIVASYTHYNLLRTIIPLTPAVIQSGEHVTTTQDIFSVGASYNVALFTGFAQTRSVEMEEIAKEMASVRKKLTKEQLVYNIRSLYLSVLAQQEMLKAQKLYTQALATLVKRIAYEVELGKKATVDLLKAKADLEASKSTQVSLQSNIEVTLAALSELVGKEVTAIEPVHIELTKQQTGRDENNATLDSLARVQVEEMALSKANKGIQKAKALNLPQIAFSAYYGKNFGDDSVLNKWDNETLWQVGINAKWNVFDFGKSSATIQSAKIAKMQASLKKERTLLELQKLLKQAHSKISLAYAQYMSARSRLELAKQSEAIELTRYENDASTLNDLLLARAKTQLTRSQLIQSKYNYQKSRYYLDYLLERGEESEK